MKLSGDFPTVLLPIETTTRELDSKLVMASALAAQGCRVIVGHKGVLKEIGVASKQLLWLGKSLFSTRSSHHFADHFLKRGSAIMLIHDEGAIYQVKPWIYELLRTHYAERLQEKNINRVCVWGTRQKNILSSYANKFSDFITVTGSPRFDLCLPHFSWLTKQKVEENKSKYSPFILICTRFTAAVHARGPADLFCRSLNPARLSRKHDKTDILDFNFSTWQRDVHDFADFVILIKEIAHHYPQYTVILRPHPSENLAFYKAAFASFKNVLITSEDNVLPWIRSAELVVHCNCTTGIEAVLAGRPVLNLLPACDARAPFDIEVAREAGCIAGSIEDALNTTSGLLAGDAPKHVWSPHAQTMLHNLTHETIPILVAETMSVIQEARITSSSVELPRLRNVVRRFIRGEPTHRAAKRRALNPAYVGMLLEQCRTNYVGKGRVRHLTKKYVVVDPA